ncbi:MAG: hypothetical protein SNJ67_13400 [Chloracidobacterium sp.]
MVEIPGNPRLWHINVDFEAELAAFVQGRRYVPTGAFAARNQMVAYNVLRYLARAGDALLVPSAWLAPLAAEATRAGVVLVPLENPGNRSGYEFTPWGWTPQALRVGERTGARLSPPALEVVARVNSKVYSHRLEAELGVADTRARLVTTDTELAAQVARACPQAQDKWVVKHPYGVAARERILGRGPSLSPAAAAWCRRRFADGDTLLFEPWHPATREYGLCGFIHADGSVALLGVSRPVANGAGTLVGYELTSEPPPSALWTVGRQVGSRLAADGYRGPWGSDALEHAHGWRLLLEINARWTVGFLALAALARSPEVSRRWVLEPPPIG